MQITRRLTPTPVQNGHCNMQRALLRAQAENVPVDDARGEDGAVGCEACTMSTRCDADLALFCANF